MRTAFFAFLVALATSPVVAFDGRPSPDKLGQICFGRKLVEVEVQLVGPTGYAAPVRIVGAQCDEVETTAITQSPPAGKRRAVQPIGERR